MDNKINNKIDNSQNLDLIEELNLLVKKMRIKEKNNSNIIIKKINKCITLTQKCIIVREYLRPQSVIFEKIIMSDLKINKPKDKISGDGCKNNINYEIKTSVHSRGCKINFVQIRPDHNIDYYILIVYNIYDNTSSIGKGYIFKISSCNLYELVVKYGGYAHGTCAILGKIDINNIKGRNCEYALRCNPNTKKRKKL